MLTAQPRHPLLGATMAPVCLASLAGSHVREMLKLAPVMRTGAPASASIPTWRNVAGGSSVCTIVDDPRPLPCRAGRRVRHRTTSRDPDACGRACGKQRPVPRARRSMATQDDAG
jgi:hypothetical protein